MRLVLGAGPVAQDLQALAVLERPVEQRGDARSSRAQTGNSAGWKNMPSLVRAALTSLAPVAVSTVSERARRVRASAISSAHSSAESRSAKTTTRGSVIAISDA